jgi:hypothetical protein
LEDADFGIFWLGAEWLDTFLKVLEVLEIHFAYCSWFFESYDPSAYQHAFPPLLHLPTSKR